MKPLYLDCSNKVDLGIARELNEDSCLSALTQRNGVGGVRAVLAVSDGMGGHDAGDVASKMTCEYLDHLFAKGNYPRYMKEWKINDGDYVTFLQGALSSLNQKIHDRAKSFQLLRKMGCTCVIGLVVCEEETNAWKLVIGSIGDSRCYLVRDREILLATEDDSVVWELYRKKEISYGEMRLHPRRNILTQALGVQETVRPKVRTLDLLDGDAVVLCSDGLHAAVAEETIKEIVLSSSTSRQAVERLTAEAIESGSKDNIGVVVAYCNGQRRNGAGIPPRIAKALAFVVPIIMLGGGSVFLLNSPLANEEEQRLPHTLTVGPISGSVVPGSLVEVTFSIEPYEIVNQTRAKYRVLREAGDQRDTIQLAALPEPKKNSFRLSCKVPPVPSQSLRLRLLREDSSMPLSESTLVFDTESMGEETSPREKKGPETLEARPEERVVPLRVSRGQDGFLQILLAKDWQVEADVIAEISMNGVMEILTLTKRHRVVPLSTSMEYRFGDTLRVRFHGNSRQWTIPLQ